MNRKAKVEKWVAAILAAVLLLIVVRAVSQSTGVHAGGGRPGATAPSGVPQERSGARSAGDPSGDPAGFNSMLQLDVLKDVNGRPLPDLPRSPFDFAPTPAELQAKKTAQELAKHPPPPPPPPPPPINLKAMGYQQDEKGKFEAYLTDDQDNYIVREGQEFAKRFKVLKISSSLVEIEDETYHQTVQLPFAQ
ncbi:MAG TPA: hypothetical protein VGW33_11525 [Terriglobia bacterium]|nr:hypothetical protein [Terriglobia bacterium]